jgi:SAM-dependent methyltransferase
VRSPAELYDWELAHVASRHQQDLPFYLALADAAGGAVLELACGTGRLTAPLAAAGLQVVGLDIEAEMLAVARRRGARRLVQADMCRFHLHTRFDLVAIPYNSLQLLVREEDMVSCLARAVSHLRPGGLVALEVTDFQEGAVRTEVPLELLAVEDGVVLHGGLTHDLGRRRTTYHRRFQQHGSTWVDEVTLRSFRQDELEQVLGAAGLELVKALPDGNRLFAVAARRPEG